MGNGAWRIAVLLLLGCAATTLGLQQAAHPDNNGSDEVAWSELMAGMEKMHVAIASAKPSGDNDVDFARLMLPHHQAAIDMAKAQLLNGKDAQMRRLAQEIITDQQSEIELMQLWLKQHGPIAQKAVQPPTQEAEKEH